MQRLGLLLDQKSNLELINEFGLVAFFEARQLYWDANGDRDIDQYFKLDSGPRFQITKVDSTYDLLAGFSIGVDHDKEADEAIFCQIEKRHIDWALAELQKVLDQTSSCSLLDGLRSNLLASCQGHPCLSTGEYHNICCRNT